jgi:hypothetical protein
LDRTIHYLIDSYEDWRKNWRQVPHAVTNALEEIAIRYLWDQQLMDQRRQEILREMEKHFPQIWEYFHPEGEFSKVHWDYARSAFWCRLQFKRLGISE